MFARTQRARTIAVRVARQATRRCYASTPEDKVPARLFSLWECAAAATLCAIGGAGISTYLSNKAGPSLGSEVSRLHPPSKIPYADSDDTAKPEYYTDHARPMHDRMEAYVLDLQDRLVTALESLDPSQKFVRDRWERSDGHGYGISCVLQDGAALEKAGVNVSVISGTLTPGQLKSMRDRRAQTAELLSDSEQFDFRVAGISVVVHPRNPHAPTAHMNYRRFEVFRQNAPEGEPPVMA
ncbi:Coproporphyrinogen-III oxidase, partial [Coemansia linderi]